MNPFDETHDAEERAILAALGEAMATDGGVPADALPSKTANSEADPEAEATLSRLYLEVLGLAPYALDPVSPAPGSFDRVLEQIAGKPAAARPLAPVIPITPIASAASNRPNLATESRVDRGPSERQPAAVVAPAQARRSRWPLALAALLALAFLGTTLWLARERNVQLETIASLEQRLAETERAAEEARAASSEVEKLRETVQLVTATTVEITPLRPPGDQPQQPGARGLLFVAADHQHWHLSLEGLAPSDSAHRYQLWFLAESGAVSAGTFTATPGAPIALSSEHMPEGTRGVLVTLEPQQGSPLPNGPEILRAG